MEKIDRRELICTAIVAGVLAFAGGGIAGYALIYSPAGDVPVQMDNGLLRLESKWIHLLVPVIFQMVLFVIPLVQAIRWHSFASKITEGVRAFNTQHPEGRGVDVVRLYRTLCIAVIGLAVASFAVAIRQSFMVLNLR